jgi:chemotaxis protein MotA
LDLSTVIGIGAAFGLMLMAILQGGPLSIFVNLPSIMIVFGGTFGNTLVHYPFGDVFDAMNVAKKTFLHKEMSINNLIMQLMEFANKARKEGILALQGAMETVEDDFQPFP